MSAAGVPVVDVVGDCRDPRFPLVHVDNSSIAESERAQELLTTTPMPIGHIARKVGFRHEEYMGVVFRKKLGLTPLEVPKGKTAKPPKRRRG
jgi:methylphosphotriester-DNA--protein-cysteine methyltransferase